MPTNLKKDYAKITRHLRQRVREYPDYLNEGPGEDEDPISLITLGFDFDQSGWVAIVFDTRPKASPDGEWNGYIEENLFECDHWTSRSGKVTLLDSSMIKLDDDTDLDILANYLGEMLRKLLRDARDNGLLEPLPTTADCQLCVEHSDGYFGSLDYLDGRPVKQSEEEVQSQIQAKLGRLPIDEQVSYWIKILDRMLAGKTTELSDLVLFPDKVAHDALEQIGEPAVMPILKLIFKWARYPEWTGDRPQRNFDDSTVGEYICPLIWCLGKIGHKSSAVEKQLLRILRRAIDTNSTRRLWGTAPFHIANTLHELFDYPEPKMHYTNNSLTNADKFL